MIEITLDTPMIEAPLHYHLIHFSIYASDDNQAPLYVEEKVRKLVGRNEWFTYACKARLNSSVL